MLTQHIANKNQRHANLALLKRIQSEKLNFAQVPSEQTPVEQCYREIIIFIRETLNRVCFKLHKIGNMVGLNVESDINIGKIIREFSKHFHE